MYIILIMLFMIELVLVQACQPRPLRQNYMSKIIIEEVHGIKPREIFDKLIYINDLHFVFL